MATLCWMDTKKQPQKNEYLCDKFVCDMRDMTGFSRNAVKNVFRSTRVYDKEACEADGRSNKEGPNYDPQYKYKELIDAFIVNAQKMYNPNRDCSLDKSMDALTVLIGFVSITVG